MLRNRVGSVEAATTQDDLTVGDQFIDRAVPKHRGRGCLGPLESAERGIDSAAEGDDACGFPVCGQFARIGHMVAASVVGHQRRDSTCRRTAEDDLSGVDMEFIGVQDQIGDRCRTVLRRHIEGILQHLDIADADMSLALQAEPVVDRHGGIAPFGEEGAVIDVPLTEPRAFEEAAAEDEDDGVAVGGCCGLVDIQVERRVALNKGITLAGISANDGQEGQHKGGKDSRFHTHSANLGCKNTKNYL